jgi:anti-sigma regulatory factor (Ser/Thr protein kinase)
MSHINIAALEYDVAIRLIHDANPDLSSIDMTIDFGADHSQSKIIRDFVGQIFDTHMIKAPWKGRFVLITDELINNAIEHGSTA